MLYLSRASFGTPTLSAASQPDRLASRRPDRVGRPIRVAKSIAYSGSSMLYANGLKIEVVMHEIYEKLPHFRRGAPRFYRRASCFYRRAQRFIAARRALGAARHALGMARHAFIAVRHAFTAARRALTPNATLLPPRAALLPPRAAPKARRFLALS